MPKNRQTPVPIGDKGMVGQNVRILQMSNFKYSAVPDT